MDLYREAALFYIRCTATELAPGNAQENDYIYI